MKNAQEIAFGFVIFFMIDRMSRLISSLFAEQRNLTDIQLERVRCSVELFALLIVFLVLLKR